MTTTRQSYQARLNRVLVHMESRLDEPLGLEELAEVACFSPYHFHRIFTGMVGESVAAHLRRLRLERAANRLAFTDQSVTDIALAAGYERTEAFIRAFGRLFGASPGEYRRSSRAGGPAASRPQPTKPALAGKEDAMGKDPMMDVEIRTVDPMRVAFVRHVGPYEQCGSAWEALCGWAGPRRLLRRQTVFIGIGHDDPKVTASERVRYDACVTVGPDVEPEGPVGIKEVGGGEYAVAVHKGPYSGLEAAYAWLCGVWAPGAGREIRAEPALELYINHPDSTPPEELLTALHIPLEPAA